MLMQNYRNEINDISVFYCNAVILIWVSQWNYQLLPSFISDFIVKHFCDSYTF